MKLTEEQKKQIAKRLAKAAAIILEQDAYSARVPYYAQKKFKEKFLEELTKMETEKSETKKAEPATGTGSVGTFDY